MLEIFVDKDGRIAFPDEFQAEILRGDFDPDKVEVKYVDDQAVKKRLDELASRLWNHEFSGSIKVFEYETDEKDHGGEKKKWLSASKHIFLNAHPEVQHEHVRHVLGLVRAAGFWDDVTYGTIVLDGKALPLTFSPPRRKESSSAGKADGGRGVKNSGCIKIEIGQSDRYFSFEKCPCTFARVDTNLKKIIATSSRDVPVKIFCDLDSLHRSLIAVLSLCAKHGMSNVMILSM